MRNFRQLLELPDYITLLSAASGMFSIICSMAGNYTVAAWLMIVSVVFDRADGHIARLIDRREKDFGREIDSLSDCLAFGVAPAVFGYALGLKDGFSILVLIFFVSAAILRLARNNVQGTDKDHYQGMNVAYNGIIFPSIYFIRLNLPFHLGQFVPVYLLTGLLMLSSIKWKKI